MNKKDFNKRINFMEGIKYYDLRKLDLLSQRKYFFIQRKAIVLESDRIKEKIRRDRMNLVRLMYGK